MNGCTDARIDLDLCLRIGMRMRRMKGETDWLGTLLYKSTSTTVCAGANDLGIDLALTGAQDWT